MNGTLNHYELMSIISVRLPEKDIQAKKDALQSDIKKLSQKITSVIDMGIRDLAYKIKAQGKGYYFVVTFEALSDKIDEFKKKLDLDIDLMRYMLLKIPQGHTVDASKKPVAQKSATVAGDPKITKTRKKIAEKKALEAAEAVEEAKHKTRKKATHVEKMPEIDVPVAEEKKEAPAKEKAKSIDDLSKKIDDLLESI
jgi:small subunit ribosomal protein S6